MKFTDGFGYIITVHSVEKVATQMWDDEGNEFKGHACQCTDNCGDEWSDAIEHLETMFTKCDE